MSQYNEALSKMWKKDPTNPANFAGHRESKMNVRGAATSLA